jgi:CBS domain-containing protein
MTHDPTTVGIEADVRTARDLMLDGGFRHLPVLDGAELVGIVSIRDISRAD